MTDNLNRAKGIVYGLAIGDALGRMTEFMSLHRIKSTYGEDGITALAEPALFTDDTQMSIAVAEALVRSGDKDVETTKKTWVSGLHS